ncbi:MAG: hypothetical protein RIT27_920 [Pseudomonadota bacterium]|jgi:type IV pilus assembly protein PilW
MKRQQHLQGFTLLEILISLVIGLVLMTGVVSLMINSKRAYNVQNDLAGLQENARFAVEFIAKDARMAGYQGCAGGMSLSVQGLNNQTVSGAGVQSDVLLISSADTSRNAFAVMHCPPFEVYGQLFGLTSGAYQTICPPTGNANFPAPTPFMRGRTAFNFDYSGGAPSATGCNQSSTSTACFGIGGDIRANDTVVVADCNGSNTYQVSNVTFSGGRPTGVTLSTGLTRTYANGQQSYGAEMRRLQNRRYYVALSQGRSVLCRDTLALNAALDCNIANGAEVLIEGVENMQLRYLVNLSTPTATPSFQYLPASAANLNWDSVRGIRVTLLMQSVETRTDRDLAAQTFSLDETEFPNYTPPDQLRLRRVFSNTVMLRNRS